MGITSIEWTDRTWNPTRGCSRVSEGCRNCYAERTATRFSNPGGPFEDFIRADKPQWTGKVELIEKHLEDPLHWRKPQRVFVNSMSDLFHEALPYEAKARVLSVIREATWHTHQVLTKRPFNMLRTMTRFYREWIDNIGPNPLPHLWLGVSVEDQATADERIPLLLKTPAAVRFVSYEPALGPVDFSRYLPGRVNEHWTGHADESPRSEWGLDWIIVGGESGPEARPFDIAWARNTVAQCKAAGVACFVKQLGPRPFVCCMRDQMDWVKLYEYGRHTGRYGPRFGLKDRKGGNWDEWPKDLRVREFPA